MSWKDYYQSRIVTAEEAAAKNSGRGSNILRTCYG